MNAALSLRVTIAQDRPWSIQAPLRSCANDPENEDLIDPCGNESGRFV